MAYSDKVLEHYNNPRNVGSFDQADTNDHGEDDGHGKHRG